MRLSWRWLSELVDLAGTDPAEGARLLSLRVADVEGLERVAEKAGGRDFSKATAQCLVRGELELTVVLGAAEPLRTIREIIYARPSTGTT